MATAQICSEGSQLWLLRWRFETVALILHKPVDSVCLKKHFIIKKKILFQFIRFLKVQFTDIAGKSENNWDTDFHTSIKPNNQLCCLKNKTHTEASHSLTPCCCVCWYFVDSFVNDSFSRLKGPNVNFCFLHIDNDEEEGNKEQPDVQ